MVTVLRERDFFQLLGNDKVMMKLSADAASLGAVIPEVEKKFPGQMKSPKVWFKQKEIQKMKKLSSRKLRKMSKCFLTQPGNFKIKTILPCGATGCCVPTVTR